MADEQPKKRVRRRRGRELTPEEVGQHVRMLPLDFELTPEQRESLRRAYATLAQWRAEEQQRAEDEAEG